MTDLSVVFLGNHAWSVPTLEALASAGGIDVVEVITNPPRPAGRGSTLRATPVAAAAVRLELPRLEVDGVRGGEGSSAILDLEPDVLVVVAYGELLPARILDVPRLGSLNLHFSLLPRWRGAAPVQRAILEGDEATGVTVMLLDEGLDTGPVVRQQDAPISADDDTGSLGQRLADLGAPLVVEAIRALDDGSADVSVQDPAPARLAPKLQPDERVLDWSSDPFATSRRIRAFAPLPGALTSFRDDGLKVLKAEVVEDAAAGEPGSLGVGEDGIPFVASRAGAALRLLEVVPAGKNRMSGADWARGARFEPGERLG